VAAEEPEIAAKNIPDTATTNAKPPAINPTKAFAKFTNLLVTPPADINEPANIKNGKAIKENESTAVNILWATTIKGISITA
jgi:hypothetical protein